MSDWPEGVYVHPTAVVSPAASLAEEVKVWHFCHVREGAALDFETEETHTLTLTAYDWVGGVGARLASDTLVVVVRVQPLFSRYSQHLVY